MRRRSGWSVVALMPVYPPRVGPWRDICRTHRSQFEREHGATLVEVRSTVFLVQPQELVSLFPGDVGHGAVVPASIEHRGGHEVTQMQERRSTSRHERVPSDHRTCLGRCATSGTAQAGEHAVLWGRCRSPKSGRGNASPADRNAAAAAPLGQRDISPVRIAWSPYAGSPPLGPPSVIDQHTTTCPAARSTSDHCRPSSSPIRIPVSRPVIAASADLSIDSLWRERRRQRRRPLPAPASEA